MGQVYAPWGRTSWYPGALFASFLVVGAWGWFLYQGVIDPLGGINSLWPLFGIANQLLAAIALAIGTTLLIKMGRARYAWVTLGPLVWVGLMTFWAGGLKIFAADPRVGFLAHREGLAAKLASGAIAPDKLAETAMLMRNDLLNAVIAGLFMAMAALVIGLSAARWVRLLSGRETPETAESETRYHPESLEVPV